MLELTFFTPEAHVRCFSAPRIVIGAGSNDLAQIPLPVLEWEPEHLIFTQDAQGTWAINQSNDPFVLLDNRPFSKRRLEAGSSYQIALRGLSILCRVLSIIQGENTDNLLAPPQEGKADLDLDLANLLQEVENFPNTQNIHVPVPKELPPPPKATHLRIPKYPAPSIPASAPAHFSPTHAPVAEKPASVLEEPSLPGKDRAASLAWKLALASGATIFLLVAAFSLTVYGAFTATNHQAEFLAAQDVADVAMALVHARLHPDKQKIYNLADPDFLRGHLTDLLGAEFPVNLNMSPQGHLKNSAYLLRLYTNQDISQFVIVAQPESTLWYWLIQPHTIFLDSATMKLHKTQDVRMVNRILAQSNLFQGTQLASLAPLLAKSSVIPLRTLSYEMNRREFAPPRELKMLRPGSENQIYNAPRYYRLGDSLFKLLAELKSNPSIEKAVIHEHLQALSVFHNMVLYTIGSLHTAQKAVKALQMHFPEEQFLIGHMKLDQENQTLLASQLVAPEPETPLSDLPALADIEKHPLQIKIEELSQARKKAIAPLTEEMLTQIAAHAETPSEQFYDTMKDLLERCKQIDSPSAQDLRNTLAHFYLEYVVKEPRVAFTEFANYAEAAGLSSYLPTEQGLTTPPRNANAPIDLLPWTNKIKEATNLHALDRSLLMFDQWLLDQSITDRQQLTTLSQPVKQAAKLRLEQLLMSPKRSVSFQERQRPILLHLLDTLLAVPAHEKEIYLKEFARHLENELSTSLEDP